VDLKSDIPAGMNPGGREHYLAQGGIEGAGKGRHLPLSRFLYQ